MSYRSISIILIKQRCIELISVFILVIFKLRCFRFLYFKGLLCFPSLLLLCLSISLLRQPFLSILLILWLALIDITEPSFRPIFLL